MKLPKKQPKLTVKVYPTEESGVYRMVVMEPRELARLRLKNHRWITDDGVSHRTHREAMRHVAKRLKADDLLKVLPGKITRRAAAVATPSQPEQLLLQVLNRPEVLDYLLKHLDDLTAPKKEGNRGTERRLVEQKPAEKMQ